MVKAIRTSALILLLACSAQAGYMQNEAPAPPPPSQPASAAQEPTDVTEESAANGYIQNDAPSGMTQIALDIVTALSSFF